MPSHLRQPMLSVSGPERHVRGSPMVGVNGRETPRGAKFTLRPLVSGKLVCTVLIAIAIIQDGVCVRNHTQTHIHIHRQSFHFDTRGHRTGVHTDETSTPLEGPWAPLQHSHKHFTSFTGGLGIPNALAGLHPARAALRGCLLIGVSVLVGVSYSRPSSWSSCPGSSTTRSQKSLT